MIAAVSLREYADESSVTGGDVGDTDQEKHSQGQLDDLARGITSHPLPVHCGHMDRNHCDSCYQRQPHTHHDPHTAAL
ncbi:hypothetical protein HSE3_gp026 [Klebsiella phage vB_KleS-HSE3]|nr:hypothetical protein HSE3_gp026 [Klebsiella phage vB_KleS-HSE3]